MQLYVGSEPTKGQKYNWTQMSWPGRLRQDAKSWPVHKPCAYLLACLKFSKMSLPETPSGAKISANPGWSSVTDRKWCMGAHCAICTGGQKMGQCSGVILYLPIIKHICLFSKQGSILMFFGRYLLCLFLGCAYSWGCAFVRVNTVLTDKGS